MTIKRVFAVVFLTCLAVCILVLLWYSKPDVGGSFSELPGDLVMRLDSLGRRALVSRDVPVAAVLLYGNRIIGEGYNTVLRDGNAGGHAEINAISKGIQLIGLRSFSLLDRDSLRLISTFEPCPMCRGAILGHDIKIVEFLKPKPVLYLLLEDLRALRYQWRLEHREPSSLQDSLFFMHPDYNP